MSLKCIKCSKEFTTKRNLTYHTDNNVCDKIKNCKCPECGREMSTSQKLKYHIDHKVCLRKPKGKKCSKCNSMFSSKHDFIFHIENNLCNSLLTADSEDDSWCSSTEHIATPINANINTGTIINGSVNNGTINNGTLLNQTVHLTCNYNGIPVVQTSLKKITAQSFLQPINGAFLNNFGSIIQESLGKNESIKHTIKNINCNPCNPIYNNIYTNKSLLKFGMCEVFNGKTYDTITKNEGIEHLINSHIDLVDDYIIKNQNIFRSDKSKHDIRQYKAYVADLKSLNKQGSKSKSKKTLERDVLAMIITIGKTINTPEWVENLQVQYLTYCQKEKLRLEMLKDQHLIMEKFKIDTRAFGFLVYDSIDKFYDALHPAINSALACIDDGRSVNWENVFDISF